MGLNSSIDNGIQPGQWFLIPGSNSVPLVTSAEAQTLGGSNIWGGGGSKAVFQNWNSAAFNADDNEMYFFGGGHHDYGGNEVYQFDFDTLQWTRLTNPAPLTQFVTGSGGQSGYIPSNGTPAAYHTYDSVTWNPETETMWITGHNVPYSLSGVLYGAVHGGVWEFDPDTKKWTQHNGGETAFGNTTMIGDGSSGKVLQVGTYNDNAFIISSDGETMTTIPVRGAFRNAPQDPWGTTVTDPSTGKFYLTSNSGVYEMELQKDASGNPTALNTTLIPGSPKTNYAGMAYRPVDGKFYSWNGGDTVTVFDPVSHTFDTIKTLGTAPAADAAGSGRVLEKWVYLEEIDSFAGIAGPDSGMWIYTPPDSKGGAPDRPDAIDDLAGVVVNHAKVINVLANDINPTSGQLTIASVTDGAHGKVVANTDGTVTYTPDAGFQGNDSFTYKAANASGSADTAFVSVSVSSTGSVPQAQGPLVDQTYVKSVAIDAVTSQTISLYLPTTAGDHNGDGSVEVYYREVGSADWQRGMDFFQSSNSSTQPYSGMLVGLKEGTEYEIRTVVRDADGVQGTAEQIITASTKAIPVMMSESAANKVVHVSDMAELQAAVNKAAAGDLILLDPGTYDGKLTIHQRNGTDDNPITIRGADDFKSILDAKGDMGIVVSDSNYVHIEGLSITNAITAIDVRDWYSNNGTIGNAIVGNHISDVTKGIVAISNGGYGHKDLYISDNVLEGTDVFGDTTNATWNDEGIVVAGQGIEIAHNTLSGFGDATGIYHAGSATPNRGIDIHHNLVLWSGDDGVELDFGDRNVAAHHNLITNAANGVSYQYVKDGPGYAYQNIFYNVLNVFKIKPEAFDNDGVFIYNNTSINGDRGWTNFSGQPRHLTMVNNLFTGDGKQADVVRADTSYFKDLDMDYNAWTYDGRYQLGGADGGNYSSFAVWKSDPDHAHDVLLAGEKVFKSLSLDFDKNGFLVYRDPSGVDFSLAPGSSAIDAGKYIPGLNDGYTGAAPDIGAVEAGSGPVHYGARTDFTPPPPPSNAAPVATDDHATADQDTAKTIAVLANDTDSNGDVLSIASVDQAAHGSVAISGSNVVYTPEAGYFGGDTFTYTVSDGKGKTDLGTVTVDVVKTSPANAAPIATDDHATADQNTAKTIAVLANDTDSNGDVLSIASVDQAEHGSVAIQGADVVYTPEAGYFGSDTFTYTVSDGKGKTDLGTVTVDVVKTPSGNVAPVAMDDHVSTEKNVAMSIFVLANDTDADHNALSIASVGKAAHGLLSISGSKLLYTPTSGFTGTDSFTYVLSDGQGKTDSATVLVDIVGGGASNGGGPGVNKTGGAKDDVIQGGTGNDSLSGDTGRDKLWGLDGDDTLTGGDGNDTMIGGVGNDTLHGGRGDDVLSGSEGINLFDGGEGKDLVVGGIGQDTILAGGGDSIFVGRGNDTLVVQGASDLRGGTITVHDFALAEDVLQFQNPSPSAPLFDFAHATVSLERANVDRGATSDDLVMHVDDGHGAGFSLTFEDGFAAVSAALGHTAAEFASGPVDAGSLTNLASAHQDWLIVS